MGLDPGGQLLTEADGTCHLSPGPPPRLSPDRKNNPTSSQDVCRAVRTRFTHNHDVSTGECIHRVLKSIRNKNE